MITTKAMTVDDFVTIMMQNLSVYPELPVLSEEQKQQGLTDEQKNSILDAQLRLMAHLNICTGTALSYFDSNKNNELVGVGGIRYTGIGEIWMITPPEIRQERKLSLLKEAKSTFEKQRDELSLWRVFSETGLSENFVRHLGFTDPQSKVLSWDRKVI
ncbi:MAG: hypothetical protein PHG53_09555 [Phycisphaerae bacterium]|nr:hypothetical protein [Phycisphaerae bacterium]